MSEVKFKVGDRVVVIGDTGSAIPYALFGKIGIVTKLVAAEWDNRLVVTFKGYDSRQFINGKWRIYKRDVRPLTPLEKLL